MNEDDEPVDWPDEAFERAQIGVSGRVAREATGILTKRGRPPMGDDAAKRQVTLRLAPEVLEHFKAAGSGWQTRINDVLERHVSGARRTAKKKARGLSLDAGSSPA